MRRPQGRCLGGGQDPLRQTGEKGQRTPRSPHPARPGQSTCRGPEAGNWPWAPQAGPSALGVARAREGVPAQEGTRCVRAVEGQSRGSKGTSLQGSKSWSEFGGQRRPRTLFENTEAERQVRARGPGICPVFAIIGETEAPKAESTRRSHRLDFWPRDRGVPVRVQPPIIARAGYNEAAAKPRTDADGLQGHWSWPCSQWGGALCGGQPLQM